MYNAVIFDFDYTLGDTTDGIVRSVNYALEELGYSSRDVSEIKRTIGMSLRETFAVLSDCRDAEQSNEFVRLFREKADEVMTDGAELYDCVPELLRELHRTRRIGIVTTKFHYRIEAILKKFSAEGLVDVIIGAEDVKAEKPDPEGLVEAISRLGAEPSEALYVGDSLVDAQTAQNAGVDFAAVRTGITTDFSLYNNVFIGDNLTDIYKFVTKE